MSKDVETSTHTEETTGSPTWVTFLKLVLECIVAALTALGVASCSQVAGS